MRTIKLSETKSAWIDEYGITFKDLNGPSFMLTNQEWSELIGSELTHETEQLGLYNWQK